MRFTLILLLATLGAGPSHAEILQGKVVEDHTGAALASVEVRIYKAGASGLAADLETDMAGQFRAPGLPSGDYRFEISKPNFVNATLRRTAPFPPLVVRLVRCAVISGQITDSAGQPVRGAAVWALPKPADGAPLRPFSDTSPGGMVRANQRGQYRLYNLPPGQYAIAVTYGASTTNVGSSGSAEVNAGVGSGVQLYPSTSKPQFFTVWGGEEYRNIDFAILPAVLYRVSGKVDISTPRSAGAIWLALAPADQPSLATAVAQTEEDGSFHFEGIAPGSYQLLASGPSRARMQRGAILGDDPFYGRTHVDVTGANVEGLVMAMQKGRPASFTLRSATGPQPDAACPASAQITLSPLEDWAAVLDRSVDVSFAREQPVEHLAPARYRVTAGRLGDSCYQAADAVLDLTGSAEAKPTAVLVAPAGSIRGKVTGARSAADYAVVLLADDPVDGVQPVQIAFPDAESRFAFTALRPGRYHIAVQPAAEAPKARWVTDPARMIELEVPGGAPVEVELPAPRAANQ